MKWVIFTLLALLPSWVAAQEVPDFVPPIWEHKESIPISEMGYQWGINEAFTGTMEGQMLEGHQIRVVGESAPFYKVWRKKTDPFFTYAFFNGKEWVVASIGPGNGGGLEIFLNKDLDLKKILFAFYKEGEAIASRVVLVPPE